MEKIDLKTACQSASQLDTYLDEKATRHRCYKTYTNADRIQSWISSGFFYLDDGSHWNDVHDRSTFNSEVERVKRFGRCFSYSASESVAMWMLYGGMEKKGAMLEFSQKQMRTLIDQTQTVELGNWINRRFVPVTTIDRSQFSLKLKDILYTGDSRVQQDAAYIRRSDESCKTAPVDVIRQLRHCVKSVSWSYENECRLILTVSKDILPENVNVSSVRISLKELLSDKSTPQLYCAPNFQGKKPFLPSKLSDEIDWDLCKGCRSKQYSPSGEKVAEPVGV